MNKKLIAGLLVIPLGLGLTACSNNKSEQASSTGSIVADVNPSDESGYIQSVRTMGNEILATGSVSQLLEMGYNVCNALDGGETVESIYLTVSATQDTSAGKDATAIIIAGAILYLCPEYKYQGDNLIG